jgi:hypothetical protein
MMTHARSGLTIMSEAIDQLKYLDDIRKLDGQHRREASKAVSAEAADLANANGFILRCHNDAHYAISRRGSKWLTNIFPSRQRISIDTMKSEAAPYIPLPQEWTVLDVVKAFVEVTKGKP